MPPAVKPPVSTRPAPTVVVPPRAKSPTARPAEPAAKAQAIGAR
jgi:hypothetical protein